MDSSWDQQGQVFQDEKLWKRELSWDNKFGVQKIRCPCNIFQGKSRARLIGKARNHLIQFGRHLEFRVQKGPRPKDDFDEEWATSAWKTRTIAKIVQVDEGVNMEDMVENMFR